MLEQATHLTLTSVQLSQAAHMIKFSMQVKKTIQGRYARVDVSSLVIPMLEYIAAFFNMRIPTYFIIRILD